MRRRILLVAALVLGATALAGIASAGSSAAKQQRIAIVLGSNAGTFQLTPLGSGPVKADSGTINACCYTSRDVVRDGQSAEIDSPKLTFKGQHGTFTWRSKITFVNINNNYTVATATWKITHGTGTYAHLAGHGRQAFVQNTSESQDLADKAEGVVTMSG
jgi:hypothetical protein